MNLRSRAFLLFWRLYLPSLRGMESFWGPGIIPLLAAPLITFQILRDIPESYGRFLKLRIAFPDDFWKGVSPLRHYVRMFWTRTSGMMVGFFYDRLQSPAWRRKIVMEGTPPYLLPEWKQRPVVLVYFHTDGFPILRSWLRAQGAPATFFVQIAPRYFLYAREIRKMGDRLYGMENIPDVFAKDESLRKVIRYLTPGRILIISLEQRDFSKPRKTYSLDGATLCLDQGAFRIASLSGAILMPVAAYQTGIFDFKIKFGRPVPSEWMKEGNVTAANLHLAQELWADLKNDPAAMTWTALEALVPVANATPGDRP